MAPYLGTVVGGRRGVEIGPAGGGHRFWLQGGEELWASGGGKGGKELEKSSKGAQKWNFFGAKKIFHIFRQFCAILGGFLGKSQKNFSRAGGGTK